MDILDINDYEAVNTAFCVAVGLKPIKVILLNIDTNETKSYVSNTALYRKPKGWVNVQTIHFDEPIFPDFTMIENFGKIINIQWDIFGNLGDSFVRYRDEPFAINFLYSKVKAIQTLRAYGGSDMLDEFIKRIQNEEYLYNYTCEE